MGPQSAKELVLELAPGWTEEQCERALIAAEGELPPEVQQSRVERHNKAMALAAKAREGQTRSPVDAVDLLREVRDDMES